MDHDVNGAVVSVRGLSRRFGEIVAVDGLALDIRVGEVTLSGDDLHRPPA